MARGRPKTIKSKEEDKPKVVKTVKVEVKIPEPKKDLRAIKEKRDSLIAGIQPTLLSNSQLKQGGSGTRVRYMKEMGLSNVIAEVNALGKQIGERPIGLGHLRK